MAFEWPMDVNGEAQAQTLSPPDSCARHNGKEALDQLSVTAVNGGRSFSDGWEGSIHPSLTDGCRGARQHFLYRPLIKAAPASCRQSLPLKHYYFLCLSQKHQFPILPLSISRLVVPVIIQYYFLSLSLSSIVTVTSFVSTLGVLSRVFGRFRFLAS